MRGINIVVFMVLGICLLSESIFPKTDIEWLKKWRMLIKGKQYLIVILFVMNILSFVMTFSPTNTEIYVEKDSYGGEEQQIPFLLKHGEISQEYILTVGAKELTEEELEKRINEAFSYLEKNIKGGNASLSHINTDMNYVLDQERFPFDADFVSGDVSLIDRDGVVHNEKDTLENMGYSQQEIKQGISTDIVVTLWYGEKSFEKTFSVIVFPKEQNAIQQKFQIVVDKIVKAEQEASHQDGFSLPTSVEGIDIHRTDQREITPGQVLVAGVVLVFLLLLKEQEEKKKAAENRRGKLLRSYPWFVNEMVLLLGAGMQIRNIFGTLIREFEEGKDKSDYRKTLIDELKITVHAMDLGMSEEQAYYRLGRRLGLPCYIKIMTLLEQNIKRGGKGITDIFEEEEMLALEERKNLARKYGEEAGTKLLGPMILLLLVIMLMIMIPALWSFI